MTTAEAGVEAEQAAVTPVAVAGRYPLPDRECEAVGSGGSLPPAEELRAVAVWLGPPGWWTPPRTLAVLAFAVVIFLNPLALLLGGVGHYLARRRGESTRLPKAAWMTGLLLLVLATLFTACTETMFGLDGMY